MRIAHSGGKESGSACSVTQGRRGCPYILTNYRGETNRKKDGVSSWTFAVGNVQTGMGSMQ